MAAPFPLRPTCFDSFPTSLLPDIFTWPFLRCLTSFTPPFLAVQAPPPRLAFGRQRLPPHRSADLKRLLKQTSSCSSVCSWDRQSGAKRPECLSYWDHPFIWTHLSNQPIIQPIIHAHTKPPTLIKYIRDSFFLPSDKWKYTTLWNHQWS